MEESIIAVILNGKPRTGKNTFVNIMRGALQDKMSVVEVSSVNRVKEAAFALGWDGVKDARGRKFLSDLKDISTSEYNGPLKNMVGELMRGEKNTLFFFHVREPNEINKLKETINDLRSESCITVLIRRPTMGGAEWNNHADSEVEKFKYDYYVENENDISHLVEEAAKFREYLINKYRLK